MNYILASGSPRRKELLKLIVTEYSCIPADIEETCSENILPTKMPEYFAFIKANHIAKQNKNSIVIGADTAVFLDDKMLGKPKDKCEAVKMLKALSGRTHKVITGCAIIQNEKVFKFSVETDVSFFELSDCEIQNYVATGEPMDKAGAYGIQGFGSLLIKEINGDYFNVVGLPVSRLNKELKKFVAEL